MMSWTGKSARQRTGKGKAIAKVPEPRLGLDVSVRPNLRDGVVMVPVGDESVLYDEDTGSMHQLDRIASLVCSLFDGEGTIDDLAGILAEGFETEFTIVRDDILHLVQDLGRLGLLQQDRQRDALDNKG
jgi:hypothetical protein